MTIAKPTCTVNIESCIVDFLLTLTVSELSVLYGVINNTMQLGNVVINLLKVQLEELNVVRAVYEAALAPLLAVQNSLMASLGLLPLSRLPECIGLGSLVAGLRDLIRQFSPRIGAIEDLLNGIESGILNAEAQIKKLADFLLYLQDILSCINQVVLYAQQVATQ